MADVRISTHVAKTQDNHFVIVRFYDGLENLIGTDYVILSVEGDYLYFKPSEVKVVGSLKLSNFVNVWRQFDEVKSFEGEYSIEYDSEKELYYVDKNKSSPITRIYSNSNVPHHNYKSHVNEPYVNEEVLPSSMTSVSTDSYKNEKKRKYSIIIYDGLLELLRVQIFDLNKSAANDTIEMIKSLLESE